jgi:hypothetical protein
VVTVFEVAVKATLTMVFGGESTEGLDIFQCIEGKIDRLFSQAELTVPPTTLMPMPRLYASVAST